MPSPNARDLRASARSIPRREPARRTRTNLVAQLRRIQAEKEEWRACMEHIRQLREQNARSTQAVESSQSSEERDQVRSRARRQMR